MKYYRLSAFLIAFVVMMNVSFAQKTKGSIVNVTIQNGNFKHVDLINAYGNEKKTYASSDIQDGKFTMKLDVANDIYRFDFGDEKYSLLVVAPGETLNLTLDAANNMKMIQTSGSRSMNFVQEITGYAERKKIFLDSLNEALQADPAQKYWSGVAQSFNQYKQTNDDVDRYVLSAFENMDSLVAVCGRYALNGKIKSSNLDVFVADANTWMKKLETNYRPFANYLENVGNYYDFSTGRVGGYDNFYQTLDAYIQDVDDRHQIAERSIGAYMPSVLQLMAVRDSLAYNNLLDQKKNKNAWAEQVLALVNADFVKAASWRTDYLRHVNDNGTMASSLVSRSQQIVKDIVNVYQNSYNETDSYLNGKMIDAIKANADDIAVLMFVDMFPKDQNAALHEEVTKKLHEKYPEHLIVKQRWDMMNSPAGKTGIGAIAPELAFKDPEGKVRKLSDLRGKVVLLDFWASWCGPCRRESPNVRNVYAKYHDKGFEVFSVSLDRDAASWKKAIQDDQLVWPNHVSDLKHWQSEAAAIYGVRSIPSMFLLDRDGRIVAKDLRGAALENAVRQLLEK